MPRATGKKPTALPLPPKKNQNPRKQTETNNKTFVRYNSDLMHYSSQDIMSSNSFNILANIHLL